MSLRERVSLGRRREVLGLVRERVEPKPSIRVLDLGGGTGAATEVVARGAGEVVVLDPDPRRLARGRLAHPDITFTEGVAEHLPFPDGRFDRVVSLLSFHHFQDARSALAESYRVLVPGGTLLVCDLEANSFLSRVFRFLHRVTFHGHLSFADPAQVDSWFATAGFLRVERTGVRPYYLLIAEK